MITYLYWMLVVGLCALCVFASIKIHKPKPGIIGCIVIFLMGLSAYYFHFEQVFVKRFGGVMTISVPNGQQHISATWKEDNLWVENYDPKSNTCHFNEYSKGNLLQGRVNIKNCNPIARRSVTQTTPQE